MFLEIEAFTDKYRRNSRFDELRVRGMHDVTKWSGVEKIGNDFVSIWYVAYRRDEGYNEN